MQLYGVESNDGTLVSQGMPKSAAKILARELREKARERLDYISERDGYSVVRLGDTEDGYGR